MRENGRTEEMQRGRRDRDVSSLLRNFAVAHTTSALNDESWQATLFPYWEGPVTASGTHEGQGYLEMTGY